MGIGLIFKKMHVIKEALHTMAKYTYYKLFSRDNKISPYLPNTTICKPSTLASYLRKYKAVYIKPNVGGRGKGVIKAWKENSRYAYLIERGNPKYCSSTVELYQRLNLAHKKSHVIQRGIQLSKYHGRHFDVRLMMMRNVKRIWKFTGMLAKVAGRSSIITNVNRGGGYTVPIETALKRSHRGSETRIKTEMIRLGYRCNRMFDRLRYEWQMGYDMAIDRRGKIWLIEANPGNPSHALFAKLKNKAIYRKIKRAASAYSMTNRKSLKTHLANR
jgi:hypothetical protein